MKFMDQAMFEVVVLFFAKYKTLDDDTFNAAKNDIYNSYKNDYPGDTLWYEQAISMIPEVIQMIDKLGAKKQKTRSLEVACEFRKQLDESMKPVGTLKKIFGGTVLQKSHPAPHLRKDLAIKNFKLLFMQMATRGFQHL